MLKGGALRSVFGENQGSCKVLKTLFYLPISAAAKSLISSVLKGTIEHFTLWCFLEQGFIACLRCPGVLEVWEQVSGDALVDKQSQTSKLPLRGLLTPSLSAPPCAVLVTVCLAAIPAQGRCWWGPRVNTLHSILLPLEDTKNHLPELWSLAKPVLQGWYSGLTDKVVCHVSLHVLWRSGLKLCHWWQPCPRSRS